MGAHLAQVVPRAEGLAGASDDHDADRRIAGDIVERRLQRAVQMLSDGERPSDVATSLGFYDASAFTRAFKRRFDVPPSQYAQEAYDRLFKKN